MKLDDLATFVAVYRAGGFAPVANERGVAPSSISRAIASLEAHLQTRLFQRTTRKLTPTEAGDAYYARVAAVVEELEAARAEAIDQTREPTGLLRVTASVSFGQIVIAPRLSAFRAAFPRITLELVLSDRPLDLVAERIDVAVRHGRLRDNTSISRKLMDVRYHLVASPRYLANAPPIHAPDDIAAHRTASFSYDAFRDTWRFRRADDAREVPIRPALIVTNAAALAQCVRDGAGLALLADWTIRDDLANGALVDVLPDWVGSGADVDPSVWLVFPSRAFVPAKTRVFGDFLLANRRTA